jgi:hypothetical protein
MTEHGHNFIREIAEAYSALEALPGLNGRIAQLGSELEDAQEHSQRLELKLIDRANEIDDLRSKLRSVEAERDEATFREMATSDKANATRDALQLIREAANEAIVGLTGSKKSDMVFMSPEERRDWEQHKSWQAEMARQDEMTAAKAIATKAEVSADVFPTPAPESVTGTGAEAVAFASEPTAPPAVFTESPSDQAPHGTSEAPDNTVSVSTGSGHCMSVGPEAKPYVGKLYIREPAIIARDVWLMGGGTDATYDWRPGQELPAEAA